MGVPLPATIVCSMSCLGGRLAGKATVGLVLKAPVTLMPVSSTTGVSAEAGALAVGVEVVGDGWLDAGLDPADGEREPDEQALSATTTATSSASSAGPARNRVRATFPIESHPVVRQPFEPNRPTPQSPRGSTRRCGGPGGAITGTRSNEPLDRNNLCDRVAPPAPRTPSAESGGRPRRSPDDRSGT